MYTACINFEFKFGTLTKELNTNCKQTSEISEILKSLNKNC